MFYGLNKLALMASNALVVLSGNVDFLKDPAKNNGAFSGLQELAKGYFASAYQVMQVVGICMFVLAGLAAALMFGIFKDSQKVKENKSWLIRILAAVAIFALVLTLVGLAFNVGNEVSVDGTPTPGTPTPAASIEYNVDYNI